MRSLKSIQGQHEIVKGYDYSDVDEERDQDAQYSDGALTAMTKVLALADLPEAERETKVVELTNAALKYQSHGDDYNDAWHFGYESALVWCLNRVSRRPYTVEELHTEFDNHDHDFEWKGKSDENRNYIYECPHCEMKLT